MHALTFFRRYAVLGAVLLLFAPVHAQTATRFLVQSTKKKPLEHVRVTRGNSVAFTDANGKISLYDVKKGETIVFEVRTTSPPDVSPHLPNDSDEAHMSGSEKTRFSEGNTPRTVFVAPEDNPPGLRMIFIDLKPTTVIETSPPKDSIYQMAETQAEFPGGMSALQLFLAENVKYPPAALEQKPEGRVFLKFIVERDGSVTNVNVLRGISGCLECDREAVRVVKLMPKWTPAKMNGQNVRSEFSLPIKFSVD